MRLLIEGGGASFSHSLKGWLRTISHSPNTCTQPINGPKEDEVDIYWRMAKSCIPGPTDQQPDSHSRIWEEREHLIELGDRRKWATKVEISEKNEGDAQFGHPVYY